jgi:hypothetical protein
MISILIQSSSLSCYFSLLGPKIFRSIQLVFFHQDDRPRPITIHNNRQSYKYKVIVIYTPNSELYDNQYFNILHLAIGYLFTEVSTSYISSL